MLFNWSDEIKYQKNKNIEKWLHRELNTGSLPYESSALATKLWSHKNIKRNSFKNPFI